MKILSLRLMEIEFYQYSLGLFVKTKNVFQPGTFKLTPEAYKPNEFLADNLRIVNWYIIIISFQNIIYHSLEKRSDVTLLCYNCLAYENILGSPITNYVVQ